MTWIKLDDTFVEHEKAVSLSDSAFRSFIEGLSYCSRRLTDGRIPAAIPRRLGITDADLRQLLAVGLWAKTDDGGYEVCNYLDHQRSRAEVEAAQAKASKAGKRSAASRKTPDQPKELQVEPGVELQVEPDVERQVDSAFNKPFNREEKRREETDIPPSLSSEERAAPPSSTATTKGKVINRALRSIAELAGRDALNPAAYAETTNQDLRRRYSQRCNELMAEHPDWDSTALAETLLLEECNPVPTDMPFPTPEPTSVRDTTDVCEMCGCTPGTGWLYDDDGNASPCTCRDAA